MAGRRMKVGLFGGSFDPVHNGHVEIARAAISALKLDKLLVVPCAVAPHKRGAHPASAEDRVAMLKLAFAGEPKVEISTLEIERGGVSYTFDTLAALKAEHPDWDLFFIMGMDSLKGLHTWRNAQELPDMATFVTYMRPGEERPEGLVQGYDEARSRKLLARVIDGPSVDISSSEVRLLVAKKLPMEYLVPEQVAGYVASRKLYAE